MTTSVRAFLLEIANYRRIPAGKLAYFRSRLQDRIYDLVVGEFLRKESAGIMTRSELAERIGKDPAQITRYLASPGNWTLDTTSDLLLGVCAAELAIAIEPLAIVAEVETKSAAAEGARIVLKRNAQGAIRTNTEAKPSLSRAA